MFISIIKHYIAIWIYACIRRIRNEKGKLGEATTQ